MGPLKFAIQTLRLWAGAALAQLAPREQDHNKQYGGTRLPTAVTISATHRCNLDCSHCQSENSGSAPDIPTHRFLKLIDEIAASGAVRIGFTGGEPLIRKDFGEILARCKDRGLITSVVANGWLVKKNRDILRGINLLFLSVDGNREVHDSIRGPGSFDKFLEAVETARALGISVAALTTLMPQNLPCLAEMARTFTELKLHWLVGGIQTGFTGRAEQDLDPDQIKEAVEIVSSAACRRTTKKYLRLMAGRRPITRCFAGIAYAVIGPDGVLYPCFPAQFDHENYRGVARAKDSRASSGAGYRGVSILNTDFRDAFARLPLYRRTCGTCSLACHAEGNYLYELNAEAILQSFKMMRPAK